MCTLVLYYTQKKNLLSKKFELTDLPLFLLLKQRAGAAGGFCCGPGVLTGGSWTSKPRRIKRDDDNIDIDIDTQSAGNCTEVNAFGYSSHAGGAWEIRAEDRKDSFARLHKEYQSVASHEKTTWLQSHAAVYKAQRYDGPVRFLGTALLSL